MFIETKGGNIIKLHLVAYYIKEKDDKVVITNSYDHSVVSDNLDELLAFLYRPYRKSEERELKVFYDMDEQVPILLRMLPKDELKEVCVNRKPDKAKRIYYNREYTFGVKGDVVFKNEDGSDFPYTAYFYGLSKYIKNRSPQNANDVFKIALETLEVCKNIGIPYPKTLGSEISIFESIPSHKRLFPNIGKLPLTDNMLNIARNVSNHQGWTSNFKVGLFRDNTFDYDMNSCYAYFLSLIRDYEHAEYTPYSKDYKYKDLIGKGDITGNFYVRLHINDNIVCHPFHKVGNNGKAIYPIGDYDTYLTLEEILTLYRYHIGTCEILDGFYIKFKSGLMPMYVRVNEWFKIRLMGENENKFMKGVLVEMIGKTLNIKDDLEVSDTYNPLISGWIYSQARLAVFRFIMHNELQNDVIAVSTDGVLSTKPATKTKLVDKTVLGGWRLNPSEPTLVLSPGWLISPSKKPHSLTYDYALQILNENPNGNDFTQKITKRLTLNEAEFYVDNIYKVGQIHDFYNTLNLVELSGAQDRIYKDFPKCGQDLLDGKIYDSVPMRSKLK